MEIIVVDINLFFILTSTINVDKQNKKLIFT